MNVAALRQHIRPDERIHGIFTEAGDKPNIVPDAGRRRVVRALAAALDASQPLKARVLACLEAGADGRRLHDGASSGRTRPYADMLDNEPMVELYAANAAALGRARSPSPAATSAVVGSTDMGNVSYLVPSIHPMIGVGAAGVPDPHAGVRRPRPPPRRATRPCSTGPRPWP